MKIIDRSLLSPIWLKEQLTALIWCSKQEWEAHEYNKNIVYQSLVYVNLVKRYFDMVIVFYISV